MPVERKSNVYSRPGNRKESTWDKKLQVHICCNNKSSWYHKENCPSVNGIFSKKMRKFQEGKLKSIAEEKTEVARLKGAGLTSVEIAKKLDMKIEKVNKLWI